MNYLESEEETNVEKEKESMVNSNVLHLFYRLNHHWELYEKKNLHLQFFSMSYLKGTNNVYIRIQGKKGK